MSEKSTARHAHRKPKNKTCENVPRAAFMCEVCVIILNVEEGELNIDRCSAEISEP